MLPGAKRMLIMSASGQIQAQGEMADTCDGHRELYIRMRAFFSTIAYVSFGLEGLFPLPVSGRYN